MNIPSVHRKDLSWAAELQISKGSAREDPGARPLDAEGCLCILWREAGRKGGRGASAAVTSV